MGAERPCPLVRNDIVTPRHLFSYFKSGDYFPYPQITFMTPDLKDAGCVKTVHVLVRTSSLRKFISR